MCEIFLLEKGKRIKIHFIESYLSKESKQIRDLVHQNTRITVEMRKDL